MTNLNFDDLTEAIRSSRKNNPATHAVGYVMRPDIFEALKKAIPQEAFVSESSYSAIEPNNQFLTKINGIQVFSDPDQQEECLEFHNAEVLGLYLKRKQDPAAWANFLVQILPKQ